ncbi:hypothetical protein [Halalkalicoccus jeotgali]|uniref:Uncharacterized protein n=1 Tax=Halalkalicoccus jeotgali (strain DSM 18796 / CECT 7217 / JCM 14584 / KCTC 4019 / B3) TaxID=795797 RepID=D8JAI8_HALJB|nr:hypothetical protein [Halalkalicoccus jeotgali]ADJ14710.1 hypothetical protein HacjB3_06605 [Halalkalicoccus jeotgali B3]ELY39506.1 hypothetical protein C497_05007 [Halalkalicoccus jeotgali B3]
MSVREPVEWRIDAASSWGLRALVYVVVGLWGGGALLVAVGTTFLGVSMGLGGEYGFLAFLGLLALIGGPLSVLYLLPILTDREQRPPLAALFADERVAERYTAAFTRGRLFAAVLGGALAILAALSVDPRALFVLVVGTLLLIPLGSGVVSWGRIDPEEGTLTHRYRTISLSRVERVRRVDVGGVSLCWLSYRPGAADVTSPRFLATSPEAADAIERALAAIPDIDDEYEPDRAVQAALAVLALCFLGLAGAVFLAEPGGAGDPVLKWYIVVGFGFFGTMLGLAALVSG